MAASYGTITFLTALGTKFSKDIYLDDSAGAPIRWDEGAGAGAATATYYRAMQNLAITDLVIVSATGQTKTQVVMNGNATGNILRNSVHLASVVTRPLLGIVVPAGTELKLIQLA